MSLLSKQWLRFLLAGWLFFVLTLLVGTHKANAACFDSQARRQTAINSIASGFPRGGIALKGDCSQVDGLQLWNYVASYYNLGNRNASALMTPNVRYSIFYRGQPTGQVDLVAIAAKAGKRCTTAQGGAVTVQTLNSGTNNLRSYLGDFDSSNTVSVNLSAINFGLTAKYGNEVTKSDVDVTISASMSYGKTTGCPVRLVSGDPRVQISYIEENTNEVTFNEGSINGANQRWNQNNWAAPAGRLNPAGGPFKYQFGPKTAGPTGNPNAINTGAFAMYSSLDDGSYLEYSLPFAPNCEVRTSKTIFLRVYDADNRPRSRGGGGTITDPQPGMNTDEWDPVQGRTPHMRVYDETTNTIVPGSDTDVLVGNDEYKEYPITIEPGHKYSWVWTDVLVNNGLQIWMPYNEINATTTCDVEVQGRVFNWDSANFAEGYAGVQINTCGHGTPVTDANGNYRFRVPANAGYCVRIASGAPAGASSGPFVRPWGTHIPPPPPSNGAWQGYGRNYSTAAGDYCPAFNTDRTNPLDASALNYCSNVGSYEWQVSGLYGTSPPYNGAIGHFDRPTDRGFDFVYRGSSSATVSCNVIQAIRPGTNTAITPEPGEAYDLLLSFNNNSGVNIDNASYPMTVTIPAGIAPPAASMTAAYSPSPVNNTNSPASVLLTNGGAHYTSAAAGKYTVSFAINGPGVSQSCSSDIVVATKPYVQVFGGDVISGTRMSAGGSCSGLPTTGEIRAFNNAANGNSGSGGQLGVFAAETITEFVSAALRTVSPTKPIGLTFANTAGGYGGNLGGFPCSQDYWQYAPSTFSNANGFNLNTVADGTGFANTGNPVNVNGNNFSGRKIIYIDGDAKINSDVVYNQAGWTETTVPSLRIVIRGNLYITDAVGQLDGVYIAVPRADGTGGKIFTCYPNGNGVTFDAAWVAANCSRKLIVFGGFVAKEIKLLRIINTLRNAVNGEGFATSNAAEVFISGPETWLAPAAPGRTQYNSVTELPPVL